MKIRIFKKAIRRVGYYKSGSPRILQRIYGKEDETQRYIYYTCGKLSALMDVNTGKWINIVINRKKTNFIEPNHE